MRDHCTCIRFHTRMYAHNLLDIHISGDMLFMCGALVSYVACNWLSLNIHISVNVIHLQ